METTSGLLPDPPGQIFKSLLVQIKLGTIPEGNFITSPPAQFMAQYQKGKFLITLLGLADTNEWLQSCS